MEILKLVCFNWLSQEREKHVWEDRGYPSWDETIGRIYLLKAHEIIEEDHRYADALTDFEQALLLLAKDGTRKEYYSRALADKALVQCFLTQYEAALSTIDQVFALTEQDDHNSMTDNRCAIHVLAGAFSDALELLQARLDQSPKDSNLRFTLATCFLHMEQYDDAIATYEQVIAEDRYYYDDKGLKAAYRRQQPDWDNL